MPDLNLIEIFFLAVFGQGATDGDVAVCRADDATLTSRDLDEIAEFLGDTGEAWVSMQTRDQDGKLWEQSAVAEAIDSLDGLSLPPSMVLRQEAGDLFAVWFIDTVNLRKTTSPLTVAAPLPGTGGWSIAELHDDRVYTLDAVQAALTPPEQASPAVPTSAPADVSKVHDALVYGTPDPELLAREIEIGISPHGSQTQPGRWKKWKTTVGGLVGLLAKHLPGEKEGNCFLAGSVIDGQRRANAIPHLDLLVLDLDTGEDIDAIRAKLQHLGLFGVIYTTHSHLKPVSEVKKDAIVKFLGGDEANPTVDHVKAYLTDVKRYQPYILEGATLLETKHTAEGVKMFISHKPMPKFRVVLVLKERFVIAERAATQQAAIQEWKERYAGASKLLGAYFDRSCVDPSRLFFTPRHPKNTQDFRVEVIAGRPLAIEECERITANDLRQNAMGAFEQAAAEMGGGNRQYKTDNIKMFFARFGDRFDIETFLLEMDPDGDRGSRSSGSGRTHRCPNDDAHTNAGDEEDKGFFTVNAAESETGKAIASCRHDACASLDRIDFTDLICEKVGITDGMELKKWVPAEVGDEEEETQPQSEETAQTSDEPPYAPYKTVADARKAIDALVKDADDDNASVIAVNIGMSQFPPMDVDKLKQRLSKKSGVGTRAIESEIKRGVVKLAQSAGDDDEDGSDVVYSDDLVKVLSRMNRKYAIAEVGGKTRVIREPDGSGKPADMLLKETFIDQLANKKIAVSDASGNTKMKPLSKVWWEWGDRRSYESVVFEPFMPPEKDPAPKRAYNMWAGLPVSPRKGDWSLLRGHVFDNICSGNDEWFHWYMAWHSQIFQQPRIKLGSSTVVSGDRGSGKSIFLDWVREGLGVHALKVNNPQHIIGNFNAFQMSILLLVCEEAFWAGDPRANGVLKDKITSDELLIEPKGVDPFSVKNYMRMTMLSNERWVVPAALEHERRFFVLRCLNSKIQDLAFFEAVDQQMKNGGLEAMVHEFLEFKPAGNNWSILRKPPSTPWLKEQAQETVDVWDNFFQMLISDGRYEKLGDDRVPPIELNEHEESLVPIDVMRYHFDVFISSTAHGRHKVGNIMMMDQLAEKWLLVEKKRWIGFGSDKKLHMVVPPLTRLKANLANRGIVSSPIPIEVDEDA